MKRVIFIFVIMFTLCASPLSAQSLVMGVKGPELKVSEWISSPKSLKSGIPYLVEFFYSRSEPSVDRLPVLDGLARKFGDKLGVILIARESKEQVEAVTNGKGYAFSVALDENGKTFSNYGIQFVPFSVLFDSRGRVVWFGNSTSLDESLVKRTLGL